MSVLSLSNIVYIGSYMIVNQHCIPFNVWETDVFTISGASLFSGLNPRN